MLILHLIFRINVSFLSNVFKSTSLCTKCISLFGNSLIQLSPSVIIERHFFPETCLFLSQPK